MELTPDESELSLVLKVESESINNGVGGQLKAR